ncbi:MAG: PP2C family protein-serine/threonine phosphatase [Candidatus Eisenbacteria bacterium]
MSSSKQGLLASDWPDPSSFKQSIRLQFTVYVCGMILVLMLVTGYVISDRYVKTVTWNMVDKILVQARSYSVPAGKMIILGNEPDVLMLNNVCKRIASDNPDVYWAGITGTDDVFLAHTDIRQVVASKKMGHINATGFHDMLRPGEGFSVDGDAVFTSVPITENEVHLGRLVVAASARPISEARRSSILTVASITAVMVIAGIPGTVFVLRRKLRPISTITNHLKNIDFENISLDIPFRSKNEFGFLAETLRAMGSKLQIAHRELIEKDRMTRELEIAREIQASILPKGYPHGPRFDLAGAYSSAREVGGDYYDFIDIDSDHLGILIADVSGKSLPGMLVMLLTRDIVRRLAISATEPAELLAAVNAELFAEIKRNMFVTMFFGILDTRCGCFRFASAGHNPLVFVSAERSETELIKTKGYPLGMVGGDSYRTRIESREIMLSQDDWLILYTDGINEAQNVRGEEFGTSRFVEIINAHKRLAAGPFIDGVVREHAAFVGENEQFDDITLIAVKWTARCADEESARLKETADAT